MVKMAEVAQLARVSISTVSRVISDNPYIADETRERVLKAIAALDYRPNRLASNLRKMSSKTVVVVLPDITNNFFAQIVQGFQTVARNNGYHVLLGDTGNSLESEKDFIQLAKERLVDGLILATARIPKEEIYAISRVIPVVLACEYIEGYDIPTVAIDNVSAARQATEHLVRLGHRRIGCITGPLSVILSRDRLKGYRQAMLLNEAPVDETLIQEGNFSVKAGYDIAMKFLALDNPPTAVFASNDEMAVGAMKAIKEKGLRVPEDIAVSGFDDIQLCSLVEPQLTTIAQPKFEIGKEAMNMLLKLIRGEDLERRQIVLPYQMVVRQSCGLSQNMYKANYLAEGGCSR
ncbi:LacI family DNA-binding transcriptional regulator [Sporomusa sp.]|uniref:LacI family DNA-binding transcriptional regulator n=1 Tax=Sporomusa sp. TaxID=2078658 RepID=UPI002BC922B0|nr:LacI family DNA-binding transcriptional regulator [Sporomusa sp.]HWR43788.1 LacI family DNA-binding transcriptional regulator [Sporomusa sp.]